MKWLAALSSRLAPACLSQSLRPNSTIRTVATGRLLAGILLGVVTASTLSAAEADSESLSLGLKLEALSKSDLDAIQEEVGVRIGVLVKEVAPGSPAAKAGFKKRDVILIVAEKTVDSPKAVDGALSGKVGDVEIQGVRPDDEGDHEPFTAVIAVPAKGARAPSAPGASSEPKKAPAKGTGADAGKAAADVEARLKALEAAHDAGILTDEEYARKKAELEAQLPRAERAIDPATQKKLDALDTAHDAGILSDEEYAEKRAALLGKGERPAPQEPVGSTKEDVAAYRDPQGYFGCPVPRGWELKPLPKGTGTSFVRGPAALSVLVFPGSSVANDLLDGILRQVRAQWKDYRELTRGDKKVAGQSTVLVDFSGASPTIAKGRGRILSVVAGDTGFAFLLTAPEAEFAPLAAGWEELLAGFKVGDGAVGKRKGKTYRHPIGFSFWYPDGWTVREHAEFIQLVPPDPGTSPEGPTEVYLIFGESVAGEGIDRSDDPRVVDYLDTQVRGMSPTLRRVGDISSVEMAKGKGSVIDWEGKSPQGNAIRARTFVSIIEQHGVALGALGFTERVEARDADLRRVFATFDLGESQKDPQLVGVWLYEKNFWAGTFSSTTVRTLSLDASGSFRRSGQYAASMDHKDSGGDAVGRTSGQSGRADERGRWGAAAGKLYLFYDDASYAEYKYHVEDQAGDRVMLLETSAGDKQLWTYKGR